MFKKIKEMRKAQHDKKVEMLGKELREAKMMADAYFQLAMEQSGKYDANSLEAFTMAQKNFGDWNAKALSLESKYFKALRG